MSLNPSPTEITTAATDAALAVLCVALLFALLRLRTSASWRRSVWASVFVLLAIGSTLGAVAHGFDLSASVRAALWQPLYLSLGLSVAMFLVGGIAEWRGDSAARALLPWALAAGVGFFSVTRLADSFVVFLAYEGAALIVTFAIYLSLWRTGRAPGAGIVAVGIALTIVAAGVQASSLSLRLIWEFDHNGLFHLVQMVAIVVVARGVRQGLVAAVGNVR